MGYNDFLDLITRNTSNKLEDYKELCRICLENQPNSVDISDNSYVNRSEEIRSNYTAITKQYLPTSDEYPKFVCRSCEINLSQLARFAQQIEENAENWEIFLSRRRMEECADIVDTIKIEFCEEECDNGPATDTHIYDALEVAELPPIKIEEIFAAPLPAIDKPRKKYKRKPKPSFVTTEFERTCQHCDEPTFKSLTRLYDHQKLMHPGIKAYSCDLCGNKFRSKDAVVRHMKERHADNGRKHQCQFCAKLFYTDREVKGHEKCHLNERSYICDFCGKGFNNKSELNAHLKSKAHNANYAMIKHKKYARNKANNKIVYRCTLCVPATIYPNLEERRYHRNLVHKVFDCDVCKNSFLTIESLNSHRLLHSNKPRPHVCKVCNATFSQASHLSSHMKCRHTDRKAFPCSFCEKTFPENFNLTSHVNLVHKKGERVKCNKCHADFSTTKYLKKHMLDRHSTKPSRYDCKDCGKKNSSGQMLALHRLKFHNTEFERTCKHCDAPTFSSLARMYSHQKEMHPGIKIYSCDHCGAEFISKSAVTSHMNERHANCGRKHQCQFCAKLFYSDREVRGHEKLHLNARSYVCNLCGKGFNQKTRLNVHLRSKAHNANYKTVKHKKYPRKKQIYKKTYRCEQCVPATVHSNAEELANHRNLVHKVYECNVCKNSFLTLNTLNSHKLLHSTKPRPHVCSECNATFNQSSHLSSHFKRKHTAEKSFECELCDKAFFENFELNSHMNLVHRKQERAKCNECGSDFASNKYLKKHIRLRHSAASPFKCNDCGKKNESLGKLELHRLKCHKAANQKCELSAEGS
ncbi:hypothetical protein HA402_004219 [Bradysia odoriphaga]|nr:hypothetical protein HA402_004219 [Bradysia odoriphaga]